MYGYVSKELKNVCVYSLCVFITYNVLSNVCVHITSTVCLVYVYSACLLYVVCMHSVSLFVCNVCIQTMCV